MVLYGWIVRRKRNVIDSNCRETQNTHCILCNFVFRKSHNLWMWGKENNSLLAFPLQRWLRERATMLHCRYITCLVVSWAQRFSLAPWPQSVKKYWLSVLSCPPIMRIYHLEGFHQSTHPVTAAVPRDIIKGTPVLHTQPVLIVL